MYSKRTLKRIGMVLPLLLTLAAEAFQPAVPVQGGGSVSAPTRHSSTNQNQKLVLPASDIGSTSIIQHHIRQLLDLETKRLMWLEVQQHDLEESTTTEIPPPNLYEAQTVQDYKKIVADSDNKLTVAHFSATFCLACKAVAPLFNKLARESPGSNFVRVTVTKENRYSIKELGVPALPYGYIHHPSHGLVEELNNNKRHFADFIKVIESYHAQVCPLPEVNFNSGVYESPFERVT